jgi:NTE family protein
VLEREHVPIDAIAGTSMGAIIGGLYASGMSAGQIEQEILKVDWNRLFDQRVSRQSLSQRRKEEDFEIANAIELGWRDGEFRAPQGAVSSRGLETLLRRYTLPVRHIERFDDLPIPFRAVATDMESGEMVVLDHGDLAAALRSSMSVPGVFPSSELDGRVLGDGGLVNNVPVDVARAMGVDRLIVVNIGTPLAPRATLNSVLGLTTQMINILTGQNVRHSLATLGPQDVLIAPDLGPLTSGDFDKAGSLIEVGEVGAEQSAGRLADLALPADQYAAWRAGRLAQQPPSPQLTAVAFEGTQLTHPERLRATLRSQPGQPFRPKDAAADANRLAASGDYVRADYHLLEEHDGAAMLVYDLEDKPWGPNYLRVGLDLWTDFSGRSAFNVKLSHNRHWLTASGTEWRNRLQIGQVPLAYSELYQPLDWSLGSMNQWFVAGWAQGQRLTQTLFDSASGAEWGELQRSELRAGVDLGQSLNILGEWRVGLAHAVGHSDPLLLAASYTGPSQAEVWRETVARLRGVVDQLDYANFPQHGYRAVSELDYGWREQAGSSARLVRLEAEGLLVQTWGAHSFSLSGQLKATDARSDALAGQYTLGGFQQLSGYRPGQIAGNAVLLGRLGWYMRLPETPVFARGFFAGATLEAGNAWADRHQISLSGLRGGGSLYLGADTGIGPMYLGLTWAPQGEAGLSLMIGRP